MQPRTAPGTGGNHRSDQRRPLRADDRLRHLHLQLDGQRREVVLRLQRGAQLHHRLDLCHRGDLRQGHPEPGGQGHHPEQGVQEQVQGTDPAPQGRALQRLHPDTDEARCAATGDGAGQREGRGPHVGILGRVAGTAVTVLHVDAQVLDRLGRQLGPHQHLDLLVLTAVRGGQRAVGVQRGQRRRAPLTDGAGGEPAGRHVHGVHRLVRGRAGVAVAPGSVASGEPDVQAVGHPGIEAHPKNST